MGRSRSPAVGVLVAGVTAFAILAVAVTTDSAVLRWDRHLNAWLHEHGTHAVTRFFEIVTTAGALVVLLPVVVIAAVVLLRLGARAEAALVVAALAGSQLLTPVLKQLFGRSRPPLHDPNLTLHGFSFPSGHAFGSAAVYGALAVAVLRFAPPGLWRGVPTVGLGVLVALVAASRVYLGAHYLSDVLAGVCAGAGWLALCDLALRPRSPSREARRGRAPSSRARRGRGRAGSRAPS